ncbi:MOSC domain protein [Streptomonospora litoralis]|uniref:MOSC domain protein n=2 Tax=Streptomonospora litoralis TaxID=2498135 RepID=A0A4P6Q5R0_9ACTN|nr:MOSC domain protein [Streptomonospora litoralis]
MSRFRPNIVLDGDAEPHVEDGMRAVGIGGAELGYAKPAIRCAVTTVDQDTGAKAGPEPLTTLARYRRAPRGGVAFGAEFAVVRPGKISVGDEVAVTAWDEPEV